MKEILHILKNIRCCFFSPKGLSSCIWNHANTASWCFCKLPFFGWYLLFWRPKCPQPDCHLSSPTSNCRWNPHGTWRYYWCGWKSLGWLFQRCQQKTGKDGPISLLQSPREDRNGQVPHISWGWEIKLRWKRKTAKISSVHLSQTVDEEGPAQQHLVKWVDTLSTRNNWELTLHWWNSSLPRALMPWIHAQSNNVLTCNMQIVFYFAPSFKIMSPWNKHCHIV